MLKNKLFLIRFDACILDLLLDIFVFFIFRMNEPQALYANPGCRKICLLLHLFYTFTQQHLIWVNCLDSSLLFFKKF